MKSNRFAETRLSVTGSPHRTDEQQARHEKHMKAMQDIKDTGNNAIISDYAHNFIQSKLASVINHSESITVQQAEILMEAIEKLDLC